MMERLTYKGQNGKNYVKDSGYYNGVRLSLDKTADRLAAYEDTGMEPEEIKLVLGTFHESSRDELNELREILKAKHEGRLVVLPCKVGDTVYKPVVTSDGVPCIWPIKISYMDVNLGSPLLESYIIGTTENGAGITIIFREIGKTVFLTREEAENALRERNKQQEE